MEQPTPHQVLIQRFVELHPEEVARQLNDASTDEAVGVLQREDAASAAKVLQRMELHRSARILVRLDDAVLDPLLAQLDPAFIARLFAHLDESESERGRILALAGTERGREIQEILSYPPGTAGALMDAQVNTFAVDCTAATALERVRQLGNRRATDLVLRDKNDRYAGLVRLPDVVAADPELSLGDLRDGAVVQVQPMTPRDEVVELLNTYRLTSLPVVDFQEQVIGVIRHDGLVSAAQQNLAAGVQEMVGVSAEERALSKPWVGIRSRLPWLNINLVTAFLAAAVVGLFEDTIAKFTALAVLLPVVAGQSGNTGAQALAVTMRGLALREIRTSHTARVLAKELAIGFCNGLAIAAVTAIGVFIWSQSFGLALVMLCAMLASMMLASIAGAAIPVVLVKLGHDPATAASIILTTVTDVVGFLSFLGLATLLAGMLPTG